MSKYSSVRMIYVLKKEMMTSVNRVCTTFNFLIKESSKLWKEFDFNGAFHIKETDLIYILKHSSCFRSFIIGYSEYCGSSDSINAGQQFI
jgi:hypothetical protein